MRPKLFSLAVLILLISVLLMVFIPGRSDAVSHDPYLVPPGSSWFPIQDFDKKGDIIELTVVYKRLANNTFQERPVDVVILETAKAKRNPSFEIAITEAIYFEEKVERIDGKTIKNTRNSEMSILFFNEQQDGDLQDWDNATVKIRVDYTVTNAVEDESNPVLIAVLILLVLIIIGTVIFLLFYFLKRRVRDTRTFFNPEDGLYYVFRDIDGSIMYFTADQYADMYNSSALVTYEYIGQAMKKGGPVMTPVEEQGMHPLEAENMMAQPIMATPLAAPMPIGPADPTMQMDPYSSQGDHGPAQDPYASMGEFPLQEDINTDRPHMSDEQSTEETAMEGVEEGEGPSPDEAVNVLDELVASAHSHEEEAIDEPIATLGGEVSEEPPAEGN